MSTILSNRYGGKKAFLRHCGHLLLYRLGAYGVYRRVRWKDVRRIWFVCSGNICRSPFAEALARNRGLDASSCGLDLTEGSPANPVAKRIGQNFGVDLGNHKSQKFSTVKLGKGDLVAVMEPTQAKQVRTVLDPMGDIQVTILGLWADQPVAFLNDPFGKSDLCFEQCFQTIEQAVRGMDGLIDKEHKRQPQAVGS